MRPKRAFLLVVSLMPFSTSLLASNITYRVALIEYWLNIFLLGAVLFVSLCLPTRRVPTALDHPQRPAPDFGSSWLVCSDWERRRAM